MSTFVTDRPVDLDDLYLQTVVDDELRDQVIADPGAFGVSDPSLGLPTPIAAQDRSILDLASGSFFASMCASTCTKGVFTFVCDGTTK